MEKCWGISKAGQNEAALMSYFYWGLLLLVTLFHGPGKFSADHLLRIRPWARLV